MGTVNLRMAASGEKPYRIYRGGRSKGKVPLARRDREARRPVRSDGRGPGRIVEKRRRLWLGWSRRRWTLVAILGLILLFAIWGLAGYLSVSSGVSAANGRLPQGVRWRGPRPRRLQARGWPRSHFSLGIGHWALTIGDRAAGGRL